MLIQEQYEDEDDVELEIVYDLEGGDEMTEARFGLNEEMEKCDQPRFLI